MEQEKENIKKVWLDVTFSFHAVDSDLLGSTLFSVLEEVTRTIAFIICSIIRVAGIKTNVLTIDCLYRSAYEIQHNKDDQYHVMRCLFLARSHRNLNAVKLQNVPRFVKLDPSVPGVSYYLK